MTLNLGFGNRHNRSMFSHNRSFDEGVKQKGIRAGQATIVVAQDGSGDAETIQEGIDLIPDGGGVVYVKEGTYNLTAKIEITKSNVSIVGVGKATAIKITTGISAIYASAKHGLLIENLFIDGADSINSKGIEIQNCNESRIQNNWISDCEFGIEVVSEGEFTNVEGNWIKSCKYGIFSETLDNCLILGNTLISNTSNGIHLDDADNCIVKSNHSFSNVDGIYLKASDNNIVIGNRCWSNTGYGINISDNTCDKTIISGNQCLGNITGAIQDLGTNTLPNGAMGTTNLALDDLNIIA